VRTAAKASTAAARRAESLIELVAIKKTEIEDAFYELGLALRELATKRMHTALGYGPSPSCSALEGSSDIRRRRSSLRS